MLGMIQITITPPSKQIYNIEYTDHFIKQETTISEKLFFMI